MPVISDFVGDQIRQGQRGIIFGENHSNIAVLHSVVSEFAEMKKKGVSTLYVEHVPAEKQELLTKALNGHEKSQKELRALFEAIWHFENGSAQERYNALFAAHKQGIRVVAVDTPYSQEGVAYDNLQDKRSGRIYLEPSNERRLQTSDAYITRKIKENDDGKPFIVFIGKGHTYAANAQDQTPDAEGGTNINRSPLGGLNARLTAEGIPTTSIDMIAAGVSRPVIEAGNGIDNDFTLSGDEDDHDALPPINIALATQGSMIRIHSQLEHLASGGQQKPETLVLATEAAHITRRIIDRLLSGKSFESQADDLQNLKGVVSALARQLPDKTEALHVRRIAQDITDIAEHPQMRALIKLGEEDLKSRDAKQMWNPTEKVDKSALQSQWDKSNSAEEAPKAIAPIQRLTPNVGQQVELKQ